MRAIIEPTETDLAISAVSISEIAIKFAIGKISLGAAEVQTGLDDMIVKVLPYKLEHSIRLFDLPLHHRDPFDRQIIAQALAENIPVVTPDLAFRRYHGLRVIW